MKTPTTIEHVIQDENLSRAWMRAFLHAINVPSREISPLVVSITGFSDEGEPQESESIRQALDQDLQMKGNFSCQTVQNTIFPKSIWNRQQNREQFFETSYSMLPFVLKHRSKNKSPNSRGTYFQRLIAYGLTADQRKNNTLSISQLIKENKVQNQLDRIISTYAGGTHRRSALQAVIFDPFQDATASRQQQFPCLQQITLNPNAERQELTISGVFATQFLYQRAYGNYLGLSALGAFLAKEMGLRLTKMNCIVSVAMIDSGTSKKSLNSLKSKLEKFNESSN